MFSPQTFNEKMHICYKDLKGQIVHVGEKYMTFTPFDSKALMVIYKNQWSNVTVLQVAQTP